MATITRGSRDELVEKIKQVLDEYERLNPGSRASVYRQNSASIRVRIVDDNFSGKSKGDRHDYVWDFLIDRLTDDDIQEISVLLLLTSKELSSSFMNVEFDDPVPSNF
jgi:stress-induced morphogen